MKNVVVLVISGILAMGVVGCSSSEDREEPPELRSTSEIPPSPACDPLAQSCEPVSADGATAKTNQPASEKSKAMIADKRLTREEYEEAFADFQACAAQGGVELESVDTAALYIQYASTTAQEEIVAPCYEVHFFEADYFWQSYEQPREDLGPVIENFIACLDGTKVDPPEWKIPESRRARAFMLDEVKDFVSDAWDAGLLTHAQGEACFAS